MFFANSATSHFISSHTSFPIFVLCAFYQRKLLPSYYSRASSNTLQITLQGLRESFHALEAWNLNSERSSWWSESINAPGRVLQKWLPGASYHQPRGTATSCSWAVAVTEGCMRPLHLSLRGLPRGESGPWEERASEHWTNVLYRGNLKPRHPLFLSLLLSSRKIFF